MLNISQDTHNDVLILYPFGRIDHVSSHDFEEELLATIHKGVQKIIIDLSNINYISSSGLRVLLLAAKTLEEQKGFLLLTSIPENVYEVFLVAGFHKIFSIYDSTQDALKALTSMEFKTGAMH